MLTILFFITVFSSLLWCAYALLYIHGQLSGADLSSLGVDSLALYAGLLIVPAWALWQIFGLVSRHFQDKNSNLRLTQLFNQMKKNQDYTDLVVRVMLDAEHEIKDGFVINKFDVFIADMNELLADIVQRCNAASSLQLEQLWTRVRNGERWIIGKALIEAAKNYADFSAYLAEKAGKDSVFKGTLLEFCARYQNLSALLEKHDRDRVFITIVETGVMGKVYSILAPAADALENDEPEKPLSAETDEKTFEVSPNILTMEAPQNDEEQVSFFSRLNPFKRKKKDAENDDAEVSGDDAFFTALQKSMATPEQTHKNFARENDADLSAKRSEPRFSLRSENYDSQSAKKSSVAVSAAEMTADKTAAPGMVYDIPPVSQNESAVLVEEDVSEPELRPAVGAENQPATGNPVSTGTPQNSVGTPRNDDFAYPFGGWMNEENYKK